MRLCERDLVCCLASSQGGCHLRHCHRPEMVHYRHNRILCGEQAGLLALQSNSRELHHKYAHAPSPFYCPRGAYWTGSKKDRCIPMCKMHWDIGLGVPIHWTGLDSDSCWLQAFTEHAAYHLNGKFTYV